MIFAVFVGYFENTTECYTEGPFVAVYANGWRVEAQVVGHKCPCMAHHSVYVLIRRQFGLIGKTNDKQEIAKIVDWLNVQVTEGRIVNQAGVWEVA